MRARSGDGHFEAVLESLVWPSNQHSRPANRVKEVPVTFTAFL